MSVLKVGLNNALNQINLDILKSKKIRTTIDFISKDVEDLVESTGIPYKDLVNIRNILLAENAALPVTGNNLYKNIVESTAILSTGINGIDALLDAGLYTGELTEICGEIAVGKTQMCLSVAGKTACKPNQTVIYVDTGASFSATRLCHMIPETVEAEEALEHVRVYNAYDIYQVFETLQTIRQHIQENEDVFYSRLKIVILDNVASVVYPFLGAGAFADNQGLIALLGHKLKALAVEFSLSVLVTNNVVKSDISTPCPSLGRLWAQMPHVRLMIAKDESSGDEQRTVTLVKNCRGKTGSSSTFHITSDGPIR